MFISIWETEICFCDYLCIFFPYSVFSLWYIAPLGLGRNPLLVVVQFKNFGMDEESDDDDLLFGAKDGDEEEVGCVCPEVFLCVGSRRVAEATDCTSPLPSILIYIS